MKKRSSRWMIYLNERFPILPNLIVAAGITYSAYFLVGQTQPIEHPTLSKSLALIGGMLFLAQLRFMDELKDFEKDKIAHPDRPLPRGLFTTAEFSRFIIVTQWAMIGFAILLMIIGKLSAGLFFAFGVGYLYLMYREFFLGERLSQNAILYAITHQVIIYPLVFFVLSVFYNDFWQQLESFYFGTLVLGGFFAFEVGRKLDPKAHPILNTYLIRYGKVATTLLIIGTLSLSAWAGTQIQAQYAVIPFALLGASSLSVLWLKPSAYKLAEGMVSLYLMICLWAIPLLTWIGGRP